MDELHDGLALLNDLDVTLESDLDAFSQERAQQAPAAGDAGDWTAETMDSSQGGAVDASSAPGGRAETADTMGSSRGGVDASSFPAGSAESDSGASAASGTDQGNGEDAPRGPVGEGSIRTQQLGTAPRDSKGPDPGSGSTSGERTPLWSSTG